VEFFGFVSLRVPFRDRVYIPGAWTVRIHKYPFLRSGPAGPPLRLVAVHCARPLWDQMQEAAMNICTHDTIWLIQLHDLKPEKKSEMSTVFEVALVNVP
jgi:hypothetical protein